MVGFNKEYAQCVSKEQWIKEHSHIECDLSAEYDKMVPKKKTEAKPKEEAEIKEQG